MEILSIRLKTTISNWLELYNVYLTNTSSQHNSFDPSLIKLVPFSLILGDFNHKIRYLPVVQRAATWRRKGVEWSCFTMKSSQK